MSLDTGIKARIADHPRLLGTLFALTLLLTQVGGAAANAHCACAGP